MENSLDEFGKLLMSDVRDRTIRVFDKRVQGRMHDESSILLARRIELMDEESKKILMDIIPEIVDLTRREQEIPHL